MKLIINFLLIFSAIILISGCVNEKPENLILGRWGNDSANTYLEFYQDDVLIIYEDDLKIIANYIFMDDYNFRMVPKMAVSTTGEKQIYESSEDISVVFKIIKVTKKELTLEISDEIYTFKKQ